MPEYRLLKVGYKEDSRCIHHYTFWFRFRPKAFINQPLRKSPLYNAQIQNRSCHLHITNKYTASNNILNRRKRQEHVVICSLF